VWAAKVLLELYQISAARFNPASCLLLVRARGILYAWISDLDAVHP